MTNFFAVHNGEVMLSLEGMAVLFGLPVSEIEEAARRANTDEGWLIPEEWMRRGRLRAKEAQAATGQEDMESALSYWLGREGLR